MLRVEPALRLPGSAVSHNSGRLPAALTAEPTYGKSTAQQEHKYNLTKLYLCTIFLLGLIKRNTTAYSHVKLPFTGLIENFINPINVN